MRVGQHFAASGGIERAAFGILDPRVGIEGGFFCAAGIFDALGPRQRVDVLVVEIKITGQRAEL
jgi:hypothetical protein